MTRFLGIVIALAVTAGHAFAQPGVPPPDAAPSGFDADALVEQIAAATPTITTVAKGALRRGRRSISIGPTLGLYGAAVPSPGEVDYAISFGLGVELFKIPILPTIDNLKAIVMERAKAKLKQALVDRLKGRPLQSADAKQLAREIWDESVKEVLGLENIRPKTMERPRLTLAIEGNRLLSSDVWATRFRAGIGIWKVTLAGSLAAGFTDPKTSVFAGAELVTHFLVSKGPRASVADVFLRADFELRNRDTANTDTFVLGVRYLLDII